MECTVGRLGRESMNDDSWETWAGDSHTSRTVRYYSVAIVSYSRREYEYYWVEELRGRERTERTKRTDKTDNWEKRETERPMTNDRERRT